MQIFSSRFDTSGSMIPLLVPEISPCDGFCNEQQEEEEEEQEEEEQEEGAVGAN